MFVVFEIGAMPSRGESGVICELKSARACGNAEARAIALRISLLEIQCDNA